MAALPCGAVSYPLDAAFFTGPEDDVIDANKNEWRQRL